MTGDLLGQSVDIRGTRAVFGAPAPGGNGYVETATFVAGSWGISTTPLLSADPQPNEGFGDAVALAGDLLVVGVPNRILGPLTDAGRVSIFQWTGSSWAHLQDIVQPDENGDDAPEALALFGDAVDLWHDPVLDEYRLIVGAPLATATFFGFDDVTSGQAYVFSASGSSLSTWTWEASLQLFEEANPYSATDGFGTAVAIDGGTAAVAAPFRDRTSGASDTGSVRVFERSLDGAQNPQWNAVADLWENGEPGRELGLDIALLGDSLVAGAPGEELQEGGAGGGGGPTYLTGAVRVAESVDGIWTPTALIAPADLEDADGGRFGTSVALTDDALVVGSPLAGGDPLESPPGATLFARPASDAFRFILRVEGDPAFASTLAIAPDPNTRLTTLAAGLPPANGGAGFVLPITACPTETDCNDNGIPDACDIALGLDVDCNGDQIPDDCQADDPLVDCDGNGIPDTCETESVEIVWVIEASGSTGTKGGAICGDIIGGIVDRLIDDGRAVRSRILLIDGGACVLPGAEFPCIDDPGTVVEAFGTIVPFTDEVSFPGLGILDACESWAAASAIVAESQPWRSRLRIVVPISDECAWAGGNDGDGGCMVDDENSTDAAAAYLACRDVFAMPIQTAAGATLDPVVSLQMGRLATATSGEAFAIDDVDSPADIAALIDGFADAVIRRLIVHDFEPFDPVTGATGDGIPDICQPEFEDLDCNRNGISDLAEILLGDPSYVIGSPLPPAIISVEDLDPPNGRLDICDRVVCPPDLDGDFEVAFSDLLLVLNDFGPGPSPADIDDDGIVGFSDILQVLGNWGSCYQSFGAACTVQALDAETPPTSVLDCLQKANWDPVLAAPCIDAVNMANQN